MWSNYLVARNWFKNVMNDSPTADLGITITTTTLSRGLRLSHLVYNMPSSLYYYIISLHNTINRTTTIVMPPCSTHAGNINNMLLPTLVSIMATMGLLPATIALMAAYYILRNSAFSPTICFNCTVVSMSYM